jgi:uncharacterized protein (TIGR02118 family)
MATIKRLTAANENLKTGRSREQAQQYWAETHGKLVANNPNLRQYHHYFSVPQAYDGPLKPTFIGVSMFWRDDPFSVFTPFPAPDFAPIGPDDRQLFDREPRWPFAGQWADIFGEEHVIVDGATSPGMINALIMVNKLPGLDFPHFFGHWKDKHGPLAAKVPGLRRYTQNHAYLPAYARAGMTHDGWAEMWFDDYASFEHAVQSPEFAAAREDGKMVFAEPKGIVIGTEYVQKGPDWQPRDYGALALTPDEIRQRLVAEGYESLAADPTAPAKIRLAAERKLLAVWTPWHLVTLDDSRIDVRPERPLPQAAYQHPSR